MSVQAAAPGLDAGDCLAVPQAQRVSELFLGQSDPSPGSFEPGTDAGVLLHCHECTIILTLHNMQPHSGGAHVTMALTRPRMQNRLVWVFFFGTVNGR